jgi:hypothetical protein
MIKQKRVKLTHGSARVDENCSEETIKALDNLCKLAYEIVSEPLNIDGVTDCDHSMVSKEYVSQPYGECLSCGKTIFE